MSANYDVFISFKNTDENGQPTKERAIAERLDKVLTDSGLRVFICTHGPKLLGRSNFKSVIDDAIEASRFLVAVGCTKANLESPYVRYEWDTFHNEILSGQKPDGQIFVLYRDMSIRDLPIALRGQTALNAAQDASYGEICEYIHNAFGGVRSMPAVKEAVPAEPKAARQSAIEIGGKTVSVDATELDLERCRVRDVTPLNMLTNLWKLDLSWNQIRDIAPLKSLTKLEYLYLTGNQISDIMSLRHLTNLISLDLSMNLVTDIIPLQSLPNLTYLNLYGNQINEITPLYSLKSLRHLTIFGYPLKRKQKDDLVAGLLNCHVTFS